MSIGPLQIILIALVVLLLFGGRTIPELMRGLGQGMKEFKDATNKDDDSKSDKTSDDNKSK
jgi:sec-independent protein translocase protein TatA